MTTLLSHYWQPELSPEIRRLLLKDWLDDLAEFTPEIVAAACNEWRRGPEHTRRPLSGDIRAACVEATANQAAKLPQRQTLTEDEIFDAADNWARSHGHASMADMQRSRGFGGASVRIGPGQWRRFEPVRETIAKAFQDAAA